MAILEAYRVKNRVPPPGIKVHSTREVGASWAVHHRASALQLCKAATWSSIHTFAKFYKIHYYASTDASLGRRILQVAVLDQKDYFICGVKLPNSEDFQAKDDGSVAGWRWATRSSGVYDFHSSSKVPLRYPILHKGSRSAIKDNINDKLTEKEREMFACGSPTSDVGERMDVELQRWAWSRVDAAARRKDRHMVDTAARSKDRCERGGCCIKEEGQVQGGCCSKEEGQVQGGCCSKEEGQVRGGCCSKEEGQIHARNPNEIIFGLNDGYYGASFESKDSTESRRNSHLQVEQNAVRNSYGVFSLLRLHRAQCAIKQTQVTVQKIGKEIEEKLRISSSNNNLKKESECLRLKILVLQDELKRQKRALGREVELLHKERSAMTAKRNKFTSQREKLQKKSESLNELRKECTAKRESFLKTNAQLTIRCRQLISELSYIYPIDAVSNQSRTLSTPRIQRLHTVKAESLDTLEIAPEKKFSMQSLCVF
ncbi:unnamed protein product [Ranitomeya imitator]|uniref:Uncharacterized protein n=1 Tax=Ranitomeya imitator TaxID=111125 RepID=A0ABN9MFA2_9NEOB|nr:unnamed protein product [Ranitomeya imitator]